MFSLFGLSISRLVCSSRSGVPAASQDYAGLQLSAGVGIVVSLYIFWAGGRSDWRNFDNPDMRRTSGLKYSAFNRPISGIPAEPSCDRKRSSTAPFASSGLRRFNEATLLPAEQRDAPKLKLRFEMLSTLSSCASRLRVNLRGCFRPLRVEISSLQGLIFTAYLWLSR